MEMLRAMENRDYPVDYLGARVRGRRRYLVADWESILSAPSPLEAVPATPGRGALTTSGEERIWRGLLHEWGWVYGQMNGGVRSTFAPVYRWLELRTLILCLRNRMAGDTAKEEALLATSLLAEPLKRAVREGDALRVLGMAGEFLAPRGGRRVRAAYGSEGMAGGERELVTLCLEGAVAGRLHPAVREFCRYLIDRQNLVALYKVLRWRTGISPLYVAGGTLRISALEEVRAKGDAGSIVHLIRRRSGVEPPLTPSGVEKALVDGLSRLLRRMARGGDGVGLVLDYLWRCYTEARNLGVLLQAGGMEREALRGELFL
ncbi:MAG TPA: V-type ATPase subunit [Geobacteraceae bacterium]